MPKYIIDGEIDFYKSLLEDDDNNEDDVNNCLITNMPLTDKFVTLDCGHKFNYIPLYNDIFNHKQKFNIMESSTSSLKVGEIRCPYCRNKHQGVLPYYEELGLKKVNGVNRYVPYVAPQLVKCQYITPNLLFNPELPESETNLVNNKCCYYGSSMPDDNNYGDTKPYCYNHKKAIIRKYKDDIKLKEKEAKLIAKYKAEEEKYNAKIQKMIACEKIKKDLLKMTEFFNEYNKQCALYTQTMTKMKTTMMTCMNDLRNSKKGTIGFGKIGPSMDLKGTQFTDLVANMFSMYDLVNMTTKIHDDYVITNNDEPENVVISNINIVDAQLNNVDDPIIGCKQIIKSGKNKGNLCLKNVCEGGQFCKIHSSKK
jgi:hypothetical protein